MDTRPTLAYWQEQYGRDEDNPVVVKNFALALRENNRSDQAVAVLSKGVLKHPKDRDMSAEYGKALASAGQLEQALRVLRETQHADKPDWRIMSSEGAILDQLGDHDSARKLYLEGLKIAPGEPSILNNMAMSYVLSGDLRKAEGILLQVIKTSQTNTQTRQNLALVLGLQGRFKEAEHVASFELPAHQAKANIDFLRRMLQQSNSWQQLQEAEKQENNIPHGQRNSPSPSNFHPGAPYGRQSPPLRQNPYADERLSSNSRY